MIYNSASLIENENLIDHLHDLLVQSLFEDRDSADATGSFNGFLASSSTENSQEPLRAGPQWCKATNPVDPEDSVPLFTFHSASFSQNDFEVENSVLSFLQFEEDDEKTEGDLTDLSTTPSPPTPHRQKRPYVKKRSRSHDYRKCETPQQREARRLKDAERHRRRYEKETEEERLQRRQRDAIRHRKKYLQRKGETKEMTEGISSCMIPSGHVPTRSVYSS